MTPFGSKASHRRLHFVRLCSIVFDCVRFCSIVFDCVRFCSIVFDCLRLCSILKLDCARLFSMLILLDIVLHRIMDAAYNAITVTPHMSNHPIHQSAALYPMEPIATSNTGHAPVHIIDCDLPHPPNTVDASTASIESQQGNGTQIPFAQYDPIVHALFRRYIPMPCIHSCNSCNRFSLFNNQYSWARHINDIEHSRCNDKCAVHRYGIARESTSRCMYNVYVRMRRKAQLASSSQYASQLLSTSIAWSPLCRSRCSLVRHPPFIHPSRTYLTDRFVRCPGGVRITIREGVSEGVKDGRKKAAIRRTAPSDRRIVIRFHMRLVRPL